MVEVARRGRGRPAIPKEVQRERLLEGALRAIERKDFEHTRVADIVQEAGMSSRSFYEFFESKEDLAASLIEELGRGLIDELRVIFRETKDPAERIDRGLTKFLGLFARTPVDIEGLRGAAGIRVRATRRKFVNEVTDLVLAELQALHAQGLVSRVPERPVLELVLTGIEGMSFRYYSEGRQEELRDVHPAVMDLLIRLLV